MSMQDGVMYVAPVPEGYVRDPTTAPQVTALMIVSGVSFALAVLSTIARIWTRAAIIRMVSLDDYLMIGALLCGTALVAFVWHMLNWGLGKHLWNVPMTPDFYPNFALSNVLAAIFFCLATGLAKGSILLFYLRIFPSRKMIWTVWVLFGFTVGYSLACALVNVFSCNPIAGSWALEHAATAVCINRPVFYFVQASLGIFTDITTVVCPLPVLKTLRLPLKQKIGVAVVLSMGALVCIISVIRLHSLYILLKETDLTMNTVTALMWCVLELNLSIFGGNIPAAKPLLQQIFPKLFGTSRRDTSNAIYLHSSHGERSQTKGSRAMGGSHFAPDASMRTQTHVVGDSGSEEYIMQDQKITKTVEFSFDVQSARDSDADLRR
ncbi:hypothetical protein HYQ45_002755 [Verticillium longisporum]|uniref:Rhodopsin domain-containing protein n=1 Tax=Verticillium longisporum TaxID=100787 RepID=A0A8I3AUV0_VERLO|nr:DOA4-independent degradation protein 4 [Verticillium dahliae VDG1]KAG7140452.1 hypothetical protein HYQ45_002755 [Verticillium longisporum]RBQ74480.1 hypothetical protein VDGD_07577 [Verticillium dahliae]